MILPSDVTISVFSFTVTITLVILSQQFECPHQDLVLFRVLTRLPTQLLKEDSPGISVDTTPPEWRSVTFCMAAAMVMAANQACFCCNSTLAFSKSNSSCCLLTLASSLCGSLFMKFSKDRGSLSYKKFTCLGSLFFSLSFTGLAGVALIMDGLNIHSRHKSSLPVVPLPVYLLVKTQLLLPQFFAFNCLDSLSTIPVSSLISLPALAC